MKLFSFSIIQWQISLGVHHGLMARIPGSRTQLLNIDLHDLLLYPGSSIQVYSNIKVKLNTPEMATQRAKSDEIAIPCGISYHITLGGEFRELQFTY